LSGHRQTPEIAEANRQRKPDSALAMPAFAAGQSLQLGFDASEGDQVVTDIAFRIACGCR